MQKQSDRITFRKKEKQILTPKNQNQPQILFASTFEEFKGKFSEYNLF